MIVLICLTQQDADTYAASVAAANGYPKDAVDAGGGIHATKALSRTVRQANVIKHPTLPQYAYLDDAVLGDAKGVTKPVGATVQIIDEKVWIP